MSYMPDCMDDLLTSLCPHVKEYRQVLEDNGSIRPDAAVNAGNAMCSLAEIWAEVAPGSSASGSANGVTQVRLGRWCI